MSLVNDMLRDLDQRRKDSDGSASPVSLTPAPEQYKESRNQPIWLYLGLALLVAGVAIAFFWLQQGETDAARTLNIRTPVVVQPPVTEVDDEAAATVGSEEELVAAVGSNTQTSEPVPAVSVTAAPQVEASSVNPVEVSVENIPEQNETSTSSQTEALMRVAATESAAETDARELLNTTNLEVDSGPTMTIDSALPAGIENPVVAKIGGETPIVDLTENPVESVKNSARMTPDEQDTIAVQEALGFIAANNTTAAYARLEQQLLNNRYAHQSRETYAKLLMSRGDAYSALELINSGLDLAPNHSGYKKVKARLLMASGDIDAATDLLIRRAPPIGEDIEYHDILATAQLANRDYEGALMSYTSLVQQDRSQGKWWYGFAASQDSLGNNEAARQGYSQAMQLSNLSASLRRRSQERLTLLGQ